jgi:hypothetical protein
MSQANTGTVAVHLVEAHTQPWHDPITVFFQDFELGKGRVVFECYGQAWAAYWGAMGEKTVREFVKSTSVDYLENKFSPPKQTKSELLYLRRLITAIKDSL